MATPNPYQPPTADLEPCEPLADGPRLPWEDSAAYPGFLGRAAATLGALLRPAAAGPALATGRRVGPAIAFYAAVGLPLQWLAQLVVASARAGAPPPWLGLLGLPQPPAPSPEALGLQRTLALAGAVAAPLSVALALLITGAASHLGLWITRGLRQGRSILVTYRATLYLHGALGLVSGPLNLWPLLPPGLSLTVFLLTLGFWMAASVYLGLLLARAHATEAWRGVLGVFLPWIVVGCCCGGALLALAAATGAFHGATR